MEKCKDCSKQLSGGFFCNYCGSYADDPALGKKANLFKRWFAGILDTLIYLLTVTIAMWVAWARGTTPGHAMMGLRIIKQDGSKPSFGTMFLREVIGKFVSSSFMGLGFFWAIWDKDGQAWHDKIAKTLVVEK